MKKVWAYNRLYKNGKPVGKAFRYDSGFDEAELRRETERANARWNRKVGGKSWRVKLVSVGTQHYKKIGRKSRSTGYGSFGLPKNLFRL